MISELLEDGLQATLSRWGYFWVPCLILTGVGYSLSHLDERLSDLSLGGFLGLLSLVSFSYYAGGAFRDRWMSKYSDWRQQ